MKNNEAVVIAIEAQKGGSNKSMLCLNLAVAAAMRGKSVLVIDCDPHQNNTKTYETRQNKRSVESSLMTVNKSFAKIREAQQENNFDLITLKRSKIENLISENKDKYDIILIDTAGGLETKTNVSAALNSHICLFPFNSGKYDLDTSEYVKALVESLRKNKSSNKTVFRSVLHFKPSLGMVKAKDVIEKAQAWKDTHPILPHAIFKREIYEEAQSKGKGVCELGTVYSKQAATEMNNVYDDIESIINKLRGVK